MGRARHGFLGCSGRLGMCALAVGLSLVGLLAGGAGSAVAASSDGVQPLCPSDGSFFNAYRQTVSNANPRDYYRLGEQPGGGAIPDGSVAHDLMGNKDGTYRGNAAGGAEGALWCDPDNHAVAFDDAGSAPGHVSLGTLTSVGDFTIEGFTFLSEGGNGGTPSPNGNATVFGDFGSERLLIRPRGVYGDVMIGGVKYIVETRTSNNAFNWHHWAFVRSGGTLTIYRDGTSVGTTAGVPTSTIPLRGNIGEQANGSYPFQGVLDEIALYTRALSASEVSTHYRDSSGTMVPSGA
jgi:hypothetical protein